MKPLHAVPLFVLGLAVAGALSGTVIADVTTSTATSTTVATTTTVGDDHDRRHDHDDSDAGTVPAGVRVAGRSGRGATPADAIAAVQSAFARPLPVVIDKRTLVLDPTKVATAYPATAVAKARIAEPGTNVPLVVSVHGPQLRAWIDTVAEAVRPHLHRRDADVQEREAGHPPREGRPAPRCEARDAHASSRRCARTRGSRCASTRGLSHRTVGSKSFADVIVINRGINRLYLYNGTKLVRTFAVATGQSIYPTPRGRGTSSSSGRTRGGIRPRRTPGRGV